MADVNVLIGTAGMLLLLIAFIRDQFIKDYENTATYNLLNTGGGLFLMYYAYALNSVPFLILETIWTLFAVYKLTVLAKAHTIG